jgi:chromosome segregation ATPase
MTLLFSSIVMHAGSVLGTAPESPALKDIFFVATVARHRWSRIPRRRERNSPASSAESRPSFRRLRQRDTHESLQDPRRRKVDDLLRRLKGIESQRTEITGYISQLSIQLHRWQLRLQTLNERKKQLAAESTAFKKSFSSWRQSYRHFQCELAARLR